MTAMKNVSGLQVAMIQADIDHAPQVNAENLLKQANRARQILGADVIVASEMFLCHYLSGDRYEDDDFVREVWRAAQYVRDNWTYDEVLIFGGIGLDAEQTVGEDGRLRKYNAAFVVQNGQFVSNQAGLPFAIKSLLPNYRFFDDTRHFFDLRKVALERGVSVESLQQPFAVTIGDRQVALGVMLCEDMWDMDYAQKPAKHLADNGADILINLSCSPWSWRKNQKRDQIICDICKVTSLPFVYVNNVGVQNNGKNFIVFDGASTVYDSRGDIVLMIDRYQEGVQSHDFGPTILKLRRPEESDIAELYKAIEVTTKGFLKTLPASVGSKVVIGVSGGMDSALSVAFFARLLGPENVVAVNMPYGNFNSKATRDDAAELCRRLGVEYRVIPIDAMVDVRCALVGIAPGGSQHKTSQAKERMEVLSDVAGAVGAFFTSNGNMTELAFGYGTLNGDLRGVYAPWMNCLKQDVYRLGQYLNEVVYGREVIPQSIIDRPPMDELTAQDAGERGDPFDYGSVTSNGYHDQMVRALVAFRRSPEWFLAEYVAGSLESALQLPPGRLARLFPQAYDFVSDLERCVELFHGAVFKRVQSVPGPIVDKRSFGYDYRESILPWVRTKRYEELKHELLAM